MRMALIGSLAFVFASGCDCGDGTPSCTDPSDCGAADASATDGSFDAARPDAAQRDASFDANCIRTECVGREGCYDGIDNDCDDEVDEGCDCTAGTTARCLPGRSAPTLPYCSWGEMTCESSGEFGLCGPCTGGGSGAPTLYGCRRIGIMGAPGANASSNFQAWLETQGAIATRFHTDAAAPVLMQRELETYDLVVVDWLQRTYTTAEATTLADWVRAGGALFVMTGHDSGRTANRHLSLLAALGPTFDRPNEPLDGPATLLPHPATATADGTGTLPPVTFVGGLRTTVPEDLRASIVPIATIGSVVVGVAGPLGEGFVLLFGDEWIEFDSEWSSMPPIPQFWLNSVRWLSPDRPVLPACE